MKRSSLLPIFLSPLLIITGCLLAQGAEMKPNIILFMADDMGMGDSSAFQDFTGNTPDVQLHTPQMERLARMGVRFTDAHTPASRCTTTRYGLLTGRYPWRSRMKWWVLFGAQGDPLIEADRPTMATMLQQTGYRTGMVGKWHVGLRYRQSNGKPAAGWQDADLSQPLFTTPLDHGFDFARFTSRSHGTSGPNPKHKNPTKRNQPNQSVGPGHLHGRIAIGATKNGKQLLTEGSRAYVLDQLGSRHSNHALEFLATHVEETETRERPFFLYYPANSNHAPYTPDTRIGDHPVAGAARTKSGQPMDPRHDFIYENDVALGRLIDWLATTADPRRPGNKLLANTLVIFTSDNGAEKNSNVATGPFRSHKGSCYEGGHRVPFIACWPAGGIGDGKDSTAGHTNPSVIGLTDLYATFAQIAGSPLPNLSNGEKGAEDSLDILEVLRGKVLKERPPLFFHDHKEAKDDPAAMAMRDGSWKIFFDASLARTGEAKVLELYNLANDPWETKNRVKDASTQAVIQALTQKALEYRRTATRLVGQVNGARVTFDWRHEPTDVPSKKTRKSSVDATITLKKQGLTLSIKASGVQGASIHSNLRGLGIRGNQFDQVNGGEYLEITFDHDVLVESVAIVAGNGTCGGSYRLGTHAPLPIYCVDADNDAKTQHGVISDMGVLPAGQTLRLDSHPHLGVETNGQWRLGALTVRSLATNPP